MKRTTIAAYMPRVNYMYCTVVTVYILFSPAPKFPDHFLPCKPPIYYGDHWSDRYIDCIASYKSNSGVASYKSNSGALPTYCIFPRSCN